jgi:hypothetical protein
MDDRMIGEGGTGKNMDGTGRGLKKGTDPALINHCFKYMPACFVCTVNLLNS